MTHVESPRGARLRKIVIVGAGAAGLSTAEELRRLGFAGELVILGEETDAPYDRTACSKGLLTGHRTLTDVQLPVDVSADATWQLGLRAVALDLAARTVVADTGDVFGFDGLVIATGTRPVVPPTWPLGAPGLHVLHGLHDAVALRHDLREAERVVVLGGGLTGCETAHAIGSLGRECVLVDRNSAMLTRAMGARAAWLITEQMRHDGVTLRLGCQFSALTRRRRGWRVHFDDGQTIDTDLVVATLGERPDTTWLDESGLETSDGVLCDEALRVDGAANVVAAGSVARWPNVACGPVPMRCGHWLSALEQGRAAARTLLAGDSPVPPVTVLPLFWSDQSDLRIQACGWWPSDATEQITVLHAGRYGAARMGVLVSYMRGHQPIGLVGINAPVAFNKRMRAMFGESAIWPES